MELVDKAKTLNQQGWIAVGIAAAAGALAVPSHRIVGAAIAGGALLAYFVSEMPCCDGCAAGEGCGASVPAPMGLIDGSPNLRPYGTQLQTAPLPTWSDATSATSPAPGMMNAPMVNFDKLFGGAGTVKASGGGACS